MGAGGSLANFYIALSCQQEPSRAWQSGRHDSVRWAAGRGDINQGRGDTLHSEIVPFRLDIPQAEIDRLHRKLDDARWPQAATVDDWSQGAPLERVLAGKR